MYPLLVCCGFILLANNIVAIPQDVYSFYEINGANNSNDPVHQGHTTEPTSQKIKGISLKRIPPLYAPHILIVGPNDSRKEFSVKPYTSEVAPPRIHVDGKLYFILVETYTHYQYCSSLVVEPEKDLVMKDTIDLDFGSDCYEKLTPTFNRQPVGDILNLSCLRMKTDVKLPREYIDYYWKHYNYSTYGDLKIRHGSSRTTPLFLTIEPFDHSIEYACFGKITGIEHDISFSRYHIDEEGSKVTGANLDKTKIINYTHAKKYFLCDLMSKAVATEILTINKTTGTYQVSTDRYHQPQKFSSAENNTKYVCIYYNHWRGIGFTRNVEYVQVINVENSTSNLPSTTSTEVAGTAPDDPYVEETPMRFMVFTMLMVCGCIALLIAFVILRRRNNRNSDQVGIISYSVEDTLDTRPLSQCPEQPRIYETPRLESPYEYAYVYQHWNTENEDCKTDSDIYHYARPT